MLLACAAEKGLYGTVTVIWKHDKPPVCRLMTMRHPEPVDAAYTATTTEVGTEVTIELPKEEAAVIILTD